MNKVFQYYVEGPCERKIIEELKKYGYIAPGKISVKNVQQELLSNLHLRSLRKGTTIILVFDTDVVNKDILNNNLRLLNQYDFKDVYCVLQVNNLEDELIKSTDIKDIKELLNSKSNSDFKKDLIDEKNLIKKLNFHKFDINKMWNSTSDQLELSNDGNKIKK